MPAKKKPDDALRPAARTGTQALQPAAIITLLAAFDLIHWNETQTSAVMVVATAVWCFAQNWLEKRSGRAFLIAKPGTTKGGL